MEVLMLITAAALILIGISILKAPTLQRMPDAEIRKQQARWPSNSGNDWLEMRNYFPSPTSMRMLAVALILCGTSVALRGIGLL